MFITFLITAALAGEPTTSPSVTPAAVQPQVEVDDPIVGASTYTVDGCSSTAMASPWTAKKAGQLAIDQAKAAAICSRAKGDLAQAQAKAEALKVDAEARSLLVKASGLAAADGKSVSYNADSDSVHLATGPAAEWHEYGSAVSANPLGLMAMGGGVTPDLWRLAGGPTGYMATGFGSPSMPGTAVQVSAAAPAKCGTAAECQERIEKLSAALASQE